MIRITKNSDLNSAAVLMDSFICNLKTLMPEYEQDEQRYLNAMRKLKAELGTGELPTVEDEMEAIWQQATSNMLYCAMLGFKANLDHYLDPLSSFLNQESEVYLRETEAHALPEYASAQDVRDRFCLRLTSAQKVIYEDVIDFVALLETYIPKLAHFYGYVQANGIFRRIIPGYSPDGVYTKQYRHMLEKYFGMKLSVAHLDIRNRGESRFNQDSLNTRPEYLRQSCAAVE